jgi:hypothetical protein
MNLPFTASVPQRPSDGSPALSDAFSTQRRKELASQALCLLDTGGLIDRVGAERNKLVRFVDEVSRRYRSNPYHNGYHALNVTRCLSWLAGLPVLRQTLSAKERFWLMVAAVARDLDHPGYSRQWEGGGPEGKDGSGAEVCGRHALATVRELMARSDCDFASTMAEEDQIQGTVLLGELIRAADIPGPELFLRRFTSALESRGRRVDLEDSVTRLLVLKALLAAADVSHAARPFPEARHWALRQMEETWAHGRRSRALGLAVHEWNDETRTPLEQSQILFLRLYVLELLRGLTRIEPAVQQLILPVKENLAYFEAAATFEANLFSPMASISR